VLRGHQGNVEEVLHPGRCQQQQRPAGEQEKEVEHQEGGHHEHPVADKVAVGLGTATGLGTSIGWPNRKKPGRSSWASWSSWRSQMPEKSYSQLPA
jgi:hypothetical protein